MSKVLEKFSGKKQSNILKFRQKRHWNIGLFIFGIIFIYLIVTIFMYITKPNVLPYEVKKGSLVKDYSYTGLIVRSEMIVTAESSGYVNYYLADSSRVRVGSTVYTISGNKLNFGEENSEVSEEGASGKLSSQDKYEIALQIQDFNHDFKESSFSDVYVLKSNIINELNQKENKNRLEILNTMISQNAVAGISSHAAARDGVITYYVDGLENLNIDNVTKQHFDRTNYSRTTFDNNIQMSLGDPVYKIVTADIWQLLIEITEDTREALNGREKLDVTIKRDGKVLTAACEIVEKEGRLILCLTFPNSMIRYINERFLDVDLMIEDQEGLKIPKTAVVEKECYVIPKKYLVQGGNQTKPGVMLFGEDKSKGSVFTPITILYTTDEIAYLKMDEFPEGSEIEMISSVDEADGESETVENLEPVIHKISEKRFLKGVYRINEGFAVFYPIEILSESDDYYIIAENNPYSISNYDHIALYSSSIKENQFLF